MAFALALVLAAAVPDPVFAPEPAPRAARGTESAGAPSHAAEELASRKSVYALSPLLDGAIIAAGTLGSAIPYALSSTLIKPRCPCDPAEVNSFDRHVIGNANSFLDSTSDATAGVVIFAPVVLDAIDLGFGQTLLEDAALFSEVLAVNGAFVTLAKYTVQRPLPRTYAGDPDLVGKPGGYRSFYSGHTSIAFAALSTTAYTLDARYHLGPWPWLGTAIIGTSVAAERIAAGRHFYTDVILGAAAGTLFGTLLPWLHERHGRAEFAIAPIENGAKVAVRF